MLDLYESHFDFAFWAGAPKIQYMIATMPRSGSTHFCIECWKSGSLGAPLEYPNLPMVKSLMKRFKCTEDIDEYWNKVKSVRTSPNGVFGYKMFMANYLVFGRTHPTLLQQISPDRVIYLTRKDLLGQAISYSKAIKSNAWFSGVSNSQTVEYDTAHIDQCKGMLISQQNFWEDLFKLTNAQVLRINYEELLEFPAETVATVAEFVGTKISFDSQLQIPNTKVQRDQVTSDWRKRYLNDTLNRESGCSI